MDSIPFLHTGRLLLALGAAYLAQSCRVTETGVRQSGSSERPSSPVPFLLSPPPPASQQACCLCFLPPALPCSFLDRTGSGAPDGGRHPACWRGVTTASVHVCVRVCTCACVCVCCGGPEGGVKASGLCVMWGEQAGVPSTVGLVEKAVRP